MAEHLQLPHRPEHGRGEVLSAILSSIKKGFGGSKKDKNTGLNTKVLTGLDTVADLAEENGIGVEYEKFGKKAEFRGGHLSEKPVMRFTRWFKFGTSCVILLQEQLRIVDELTGVSIVGRAENVPVLLPRFASPVISERRQKSYAKFYRGDLTQSACYRNWDVPTIAIDSLDMWMGVDVINTWGRTISRRSLSTENLELIENDFRLILMCSNIIGRIEIVDNSVHASRSTTPWRVRTASGRGRRPAPPASPAATPTRSRTASPSPNTILPDALRQKSLWCTIDGAILWVKVAKLASLELMLHVAVKDDIVWDCIETEMEKRGVALPDTVHPIDLCEINLRGLGNATKNINAARDDLMDHLGGYFCPKVNELLYEWLEDGKGYTNGRRVEAEISEMNPGSRMPMLCDWAKFILRHIRFAFNLSMSQVGNIWVCFYALIMKRVIKLDCFVSDHAIWNNVMSLWKIDNRIRTKSFVRKLRKKTKHGFQVSSLNLFLLET